jgi:hypothetical protein
MYRVVLGVRQMSDPIIRSTNQNPSAPVTLYFVSHAETPSSISYQHLAYLLDDRKVVHRHVI